MARAGEPQGGVAPEASEKEEAMTSTSPGQLPLSQSCSSMWREGPAWGSPLQAHPGLPRKLHGIPEVAHHPSSPLASRSAPVLGILTLGSAPAAPQPFWAAFPPLLLPLSRRPGYFLHPESLPITWPTPTLPSELGSKPLPPGSPPYAFTILQVTTLFTQPLPQHPPCLVLSTRPDPGKW